MKILVGVKRVVDYAVKVRVTKSTNSVDLSHLKMSINPFDEIAVEEAIRIKEAEKKEPVEVIAVSIGPKNGTPETLKAALAMGADRAIHVITPDSVRVDYLDLQSAAVAQLLRKVVEKEHPVNLVLLGKQAIDSDSGATGPMLASLLDWPQATFASKLTLGPDLSSVTVERETDLGSETLHISHLPAVITCDLRLNVPRYATIQNIMKAKKKKMDVFQAADLGVDLKSKIKVLQVMEPPARKAGIFVKDVHELIDKLRNEVGVLP